MIDVPLLILVSVLIGIIASLLGIGGGVFLVPILTLGFGIDIKTAAATSLVTVIVTSSTSASRYLKGGFVNINLGVYLELFSVIGAIVGAIIAFYLQDYVIETIFAGVLIYTAIHIWRTRDVSTNPCVENHIGSKSGSRLFRGKFYDECSGQTIEYDVKNPAVGGGAAFVAGNLSGLIGVGGGVVNVPAMNLLMKVPIKVASSTSNFMMGVTAVAGTLVYLSNGFMAPVIIAAASIGIFIGALIGSRMLPKIKGDTLRIIFSAIIVVVSVMMLLRAGGWM